MLNGFTSIEILDLFLTCDREKSQHCAPVGYLTLMVEEELK